ncbi:MAG TPA: sulfatase-like hydrolase/transferase [Pyrinomonadaceae bacterium]|nr:sulfatase-like hydrolase/transferase [Pyrinomonadaceae bacterium]
MTTEPSVLLFFIDGLGIGTRGPHNPLDNFELTPLAVFQNELPEPYLNGIVVPTDACLGIEGRPQSASGQTTILTGINAPAAVGYHKQGFPNKALLEIINNHSIFKQLQAAGVVPITFANAYTSRYFNERPRWVSATTAAVEAAGMKFRTIADVRTASAVFMDYTNRILIERGEDIEEHTEQDAAIILANLVAEHRFTLYEYFITDKAGHAQDMELATRVLRSLALFVRELLNRIDLEVTTVILTSDHGNIEDLSSRNHTLHAVPTIVWGAQRNQIAARIKSLADITPAIVDLLTEQYTSNELRHN